MSVHFPLREFFENSGNAAYTYSENLRDGIATFACQLWQSFPKFLTQNSLPATSFARGFYNQMCSPIQPPVPYPSPSFTGGQCPGVLYGAKTVWDVPGGGTVTAPQSPPEGFLVLGPIRSMVNSVVPVGGSDSRGRTDIISDDGNGNPFAQTFLSPIVQGTVSNPQNSVSRPDGQPDNCGDADAEYPDVTPTVNDLRTTINITNLDGVDNSYDLVVNQIQNNYSFPLGFKLNGVNVVLDLDGITIYGSPEVTAPTLSNNTFPGENSPPPPGSDGGQDGIGNSNNTVYPQQDFPTIPDFSNPETIVKEIEYVICMDGVLQVISETLKLIAADSPLALILIDILVNIVEEICEGEEVSEAIVGFPEWYGIRPGADRPAIVYLWKEYINDVWQKPTYSSTVSNPSQQAINNISTLTSFDKTMGTIVASATLTDGSRIRTSGDDETEALNNFNFLLNQVDPAFVPVDIINKIILSENPQVQVKTVKLRQVEYYPMGGGVNRSPTIRRRLDP